MSCNVIRCLNLYPNKSHGKFSVFYQSVKLDCIKCKLTINLLTIDAMQQRLLATAIAIGNPGTGATSFVFSCSLVKILLASR